MIILNKGIPEELLKKGYWLKASDYHIYIVTLENQYSKIDGDVMSVKAIALEVDTNNVEVDFHDIKNGEEVYFLQAADESDWWLEIDIWPKYYFPKFNEEKNQWYHKESDVDCDFMVDFSLLLKETYSIAMKESKLKTY